jgi:dipeptidyl aminopeptidase/acylaminoacyl peptidase
LLNLESGTRHELQAGLGGVYSPTGHLLFKQGLTTGNLMVLPFSLETLAAAGEAFPILNQVRDASLSLEGTLVYTGGDTDDQARQLVWRDRQGVELEAAGPRQSGLLEPDLSPDGKSVAFEETENDNKDLWVLDLTRGVRTRLTSEPGRELHAAWSPSGREVAYAELGADGGIFLKRADGSGDAQKVFAGHAGSPSWSLDGSFIIFHKSEAAGQKDLWYVAVGGAGGERKPVLFLETPADEAAPSFSPDGKHVVFSSDESGRWEIYVRPFPDGDGKW